MPHMKPLELNQIEDDELLKMLAHLLGDVEIAVLAGVARR